MSRIAVPLADDFEDVEFSVPLQRLREAQHEVVVIGSRTGTTVEGKRHRVKADVPDHLRTDPAVVSFVRGFCKTGRGVAAICHGPQLLIEADAVRGRRLTSWPSVRKDLENAGANWVDEDMVVDRNLITSRKPDDLDAFCDAVLDALAD